MGLPLLLLLLTSTLLSTCFPPGSMVNALYSFRGADLSIEPGDHVNRDTDVTLRCKAIITISDNEEVTYFYTVIKDSIDLYTKTTTIDEFEYTLPKVRVSNTGKYECKISINGTEETSKLTKLTVTGLSRPELRIDKTEVTEGEEVTVSCRAPGETGSIYFTFYDNSNEIIEKRATSNELQTKLRLSGSSNHSIYCTYTVSISPTSVNSEKSEMVKVTVKELPIKPVLTISPRDNVFEGDTLSILCTVDNQHSTERLQVELSQGARLLAREYATIQHSLKATAPALMFECGLNAGSVNKFMTGSVSVNELFLAPTLTVSPREVFQHDNMMLTCSSEKQAYQRLRNTELIYTLNSSDNALTMTGTGVFNLTAPMYDFNYTCAATAKGITKHSEILTVRPKVAVSRPFIKVHGNAVLGQLIQIHCWSDHGTLPINYTLLIDERKLVTITIRLPNQKAVFNISINKTEDINKYSCAAKNGMKETLTSSRLNAAVIVPLSHPSTLVVPESGEIYEGHLLTLFCKVNGTAPITFMWYRTGDRQPLNTTNSNQTFTTYEVPKVTSQHSGKYYCEAVNQARNIVRSEEVTIEVHMAKWKKALIVGTVLLLVSGVVLAIVVYIKSRRVMAVRAEESVWSHRSPEADAVVDEESSMVTNNPDVEYTEVVHPQPVDPARVPLRKGTDTVYSELQNSPHGAADHHDYGSVEYAELNNSDQPEMYQFHPEVDSYQDLPEPVD
ncbi:platelet endothelial cell adhesion molecule isoform X2 [Mugil cephalus]|uniref:platelet endothelial cell adhesion molecule isoform X2 n=1 Tax=Mugil cephalus TaxID=48193 RepID=UPI001FB7DE25|nr:platelet endothelial cell adhesion molecule isoform X2 [Mugil cephalus]